MQSTSALVSVIVVNYNRADLLKKCLRSLLQQTYSRLEVVVVDNGSNDDSSKIPDELKDERIRWKGLPENRGFAAACNVGFDEAEGEYLALLNNDAEAEREWLASLVSAIESDQTVGMCASKILFTGSRVIDKAGHLIYLDGQNRGRGTGQVDHGQFETLEEALFPDGCAALYRRTLVSEVGGFDEDFFAYADDAEMGLRARLMGWNCLYVPTAIVYHNHSSTSGRFSDQRVFWIERNRFWLAVKTFPLALLCLNPLFVVYRWIWNAVAIVLGKGAAGNFKRERSTVSLVRVIISANLKALKGMGGMLRKRREVRRAKRIGDFEFLRILWKYRISGKALALEDRSHE